MCRRANGVYLLLLVIPIVPIEHWLCITSVKGIDERGESQEGSFRLLELEGPPTTPILPVFLIPLSSLAN